DSKGFIKTGCDLSPDDLMAARWPLPRPPHLLETSLPGVFAVGDTRGGNVKRVASAVGEGSIAVSFVHQVVHEEDPSRDRSAGLRPSRDDERIRSADAPGTAGRRVDR